MSHCCSLVCNKATQELCSSWFMDNPWLPFPLHLSLLSVVPRSNCLCLDNRHHRHHHYRHRRRRRHHHHHRRRRRRHHHRRRRFLPPRLHPNSSHSLRWHADSTRTLIHWRTQKIARHDDFTSAVAEHLHRIITIGVVVVVVVVVIIATIIVVDIIIIIIVVGVVVVVLIVIATIVVVDVKLVIVVVTIIIISSIVFLRLWAGSFQWISISLFFKVTVSCRLPPSAVERYPVHPDWTERNTCPRSVLSSSSSEEHWVQSPDLSWSFLIRMEFTQWCAIRIANLHSRVTCEVVSSCHLDFGANE